MAEAILMKGGGTVYSEDCTAVATDILGPCTVSGHEAAAKTALFNDSNDEISDGQMANRQWHNTAFNSDSTSAWVVNNWIRGKGAPMACYGPNSTFSIPITQTIAGDAVATQVLSGSSFLLANTTAAKKITAGSMPNYAGKSTTGGAIDLNSGSIRIKITNAGYYHTNSYVQAPASNFGNAVATQVLDSYTFTSSAGAKTTGSMANFTGRTTANALSLGSRTLSTNNIVYGKPQNSGYVNTNTWINTQIPIYTGSIS